MRTLAGVWPNTQTSVETDWRAKSWRGGRRTSSALRGQHTHTHTHTHTHIYTLTYLTGSSSPAWWTHALVRWHTLASIVTVAATHHYDSNVKRFSQQLRGKTITHHLLKKHNLLVTLIPINYFIQYIYLTVQNCTMTYYHHRFVDIALVALYTFLLLSLNLHKYVQKKKKNRSVNSLVSHRGPTKP